MAYPEIPLLAEDKIYTAFEANDSLYSNQKWTILSLKMT